MEDNRNIQDKYKGWMHELICEDNKKNTLPYAVLMENFEGDFNIGTVVRNANAFGAKEVFYIGQKKWDRRGACGTHSYTMVNYLKSYDELLLLKSKYPNFIAADNIDGAIPINDFKWQNDSLLIFGSEGNGLSKEILALCEGVVSIPMLGTVRSLNAGVASGIVMHEFVRGIR